MAALSPAPRFYETDSNGDPLAFGKVHTYQSGTTTPLATYQSASGSANTNPVILDAAGKANIWLLSTNLYTFYVTDANDVPQYTVNSIGGSASYTDLAASSGSSLIGFIQAGTGAVAQTAQTKMRVQKHVMDFMTAAEKSAASGVQTSVDHGPAIRLALDYAASLGVVGMDLDFSGGIYYSPNVIYLPTMLTTGPTAHSGLRLKGYGATIRGSTAGTGTIFETGKDNFSTGAATNWGAGNESYPHYGTVIEGFRFTDCQYAVKAFNFLQGCEIRNTTSQRCTTHVYAKRSFYCGIVQNAVIDSYQPGSPALTDACFRIEEENNAMRIVGNSAKRSSNAVACSGFHFSAGTAGIQFSNNSAEACQKGVYISGAVYGMKIDGFYGEGNAADISALGASAKTGLSIDGATLNSAISIQAETWVSGELGPNNRILGTVALSTALGADANQNYVEVYLPRLVDDESGDTGSSIPAGWVLNGSIIVKRRSSVYYSSSGPATGTAMLSTDALGPDEIIPRAFQGTSGFAIDSRAGGMPWCTLTGNGLTPLGISAPVVITTNIKWSTLDSGARFDITIYDDNITNYHRVCGWVMGTSVFRDDADALTITASISGGYLVLTTGNVMNALLYGGVRII